MNIPYFRPSNESETKSSIFTPCISMSLGAHELILIFVLCILMLLLPFSLATRKSLFSRNTMSNDITMWSSVTSMREKRGKDELLSFIVPIYVKENHRFFSTKC